MIHLEVNETTKEYEYYENVDYEAFWQGVQQKKLDQLEQILVSKMLHLPARRMIDIGCGYGRLLNCYQSQCQEIVLLDSSVSLLQQAYQNSGGRYVCIACDLNNIPLNDSIFDQAMMIRVFHHLPDPILALNEINRILVNSGHLLFTYCNKKNLERIGRWLIGKNPYNPFRYETAWVWNAFFMHHPNYVHDILHEVGFEQISENGAGVVDKVAGILGKMGEKFPPGVAIAPMMANLAWAPWIFCDSTKTGTPSEIADIPLDELFRCIRCHNPLKRNNVGFTCVSCGTTYFFKNGVYDFLKYQSDVNSAG
jgi:ubiquinone/menaquinone biosynthesis C-methylase UbiE